MSGTGLRFGVNYVPSRHWWYIWQDWERESVVRDLDGIARLGMDHIRIHCLWPIFQPNERYVSEQALNRLEELLDIADAHGLDVEITALDGWLSGFVFRPSWMDAGWDRPARNMFTDPIAIEAEKLLIRSIIKRVGSHKRFMGIDLGNELGCMQYINGGVSAEMSDRWQAELLELCEREAPGKLHVNGVDHTHWFRNSGFTRQGLARTGTMTSLHTWIGFTGAFPQYDAMGTGSIHLAEYNIELAKAYHHSLNRQVWVQEFGVAEEWMEKRQFADFAEQTIRSMASCENLWGITWWCSHDFSKSFAGFSNTEHVMGLLDENNQPKPEGARIKALIESFNRVPPTVERRTTALVIDDAMFGETFDPPGWQVAKPYMDLIDQGVRPAIVLADKAEDAAYLHARGIDKLIRL